VKFPLQRGMVFTIEPILCERRSSSSHSKSSNNKNMSRNLISDYQNHNQPIQEEEGEEFEDDQENEMNDQVKINILKDGWSAGLYF